MKKLILFILIITGTLNTYAQETIFTDRPNVTDAVGVIAPGTFQIEAGLLYSQDENPFFTSKNLQIPNLSIKYGLTDWLELRVLTAVEKYEYTNTVITNTGQITYLDNGSGVYPFALSPKIGLTQQDGWIPKTALVNTFVFPNTGSAEYDIPDFQAGFTGLFEYTWGKVTWSNSFGKIYTVDNSGMLLTTVIGTGFTDKLGGFIEVYGNVYDNFENNYSIDGGLAYIINNNLQLDVIYGHGLTDDNYYFIGGGVAWKTNFKD